MTDEAARLEQIRHRLADFDRLPLRDAALALLYTLGYSSTRTLSLSPPGVAGFRAQFDHDAKLNEKRALASDWREAEFLFQLTSEDIAARLQTPLWRADYSGSEIRSYVFLAVTLAGSSYTRTALADAAREINRLFAMPAMVLFRYARKVTLAIADRAAHKRAPERDVIRRVTLIKDIDVGAPHRAQVDVLDELAMDSLTRSRTITSFENLHDAWAELLDLQTLNRRFYTEIANWFFWAQSHAGIAYPPGANQDKTQRPQFLIRLITRLIFCWFLQEKGLIPQQLFRESDAKALLKPKERDRYFNAILQNLFFATLNQEQQDRRFRTKNPAGRDQHHRVTSLFRHEDAFAEPKAFLRMVRSIPFVNGGLFDCLDDDERRPRLDGFSDMPRESATLPDELFFGGERHVDLSAAYEDRSHRSVNVRGIIDILSRYKFTVEENTPYEQEIALDPELLGLVFENLLAAYVPETLTTARKATGSFYTPREVVDFMVEETLVARLETATGSNLPETDLRTLLARHSAQNPFDRATSASLVEAIDCLKILDPACGSGAFPMGALNRLVELLRKLDPENESWKAAQLARIDRDRERAETMEDDRNRDNTIREIERRREEVSRAFDAASQELDYARKLYLIENCIFGVDIQPLACQIAKLRFFISLIVEQRADPTLPNSGLRPLPNLETRIVAADTLGALPRQAALRSGEIERQMAALRRVRHEYFGALTPKTKRKKREQDKTIRSRISEELQSIGTPPEIAGKLAEWDPYEADRHAQFFDPAWMFLLEEKFDIVLGNPPYIRQEQFKERKKALQAAFECYSGTADIYVYFFERGVDLLKKDGAFSFVTSNKWLRSAYGEKLRTWLTRNTWVRELVDFDDENVFTSIAYPAIIVLTKAEAPPAHAMTRVLTWKRGAGWDFEHFETIFRERSDALRQAELGASAWQLAGSAERKLLDRIRGAGTPLRDHVNGRIYRGILTGLNEAFVVDRQTRDRLIAEHPSSEELLKPFLRGRDIKRWGVQYSDLYLIFARHGTKVRDYPAILAHLKAWRKELNPRPPDWESRDGSKWEGRKPGSYKWHEIQDNIAYWREFAEPKIIVPAISDRPNFAPDDRGYLSNDKTTIIIPPSVPFATAALNSQVSAWIARQTFATKQGGFLEFKPMYLSALPIPMATDSQARVAEQCASIMTWLASAPGGLNTPAAAFCEAALNGLVYELFLPGELQAERIRIFDALAKSGLPELDALPEEGKTAAIAEWHERAAKRDAPLNECLFALRALEPVRIIEAEANATSQD